MKNILLSTLVFLRAATFVTGQCTPDPNLFVGLPNGTLLPRTVDFNSNSVYNACIGQDYNVVFNLKTITDTVASGVAVEILKTKLLGIDGLPAGTTVTTNQPDSTWENYEQFNSLMPVYGCFTIHIPATSLLQTTQFNLTINFDLLIIINGQETWYTAMPPPIGTGSPFSYSGYTLTVQTCNTEGLAQVSGNVYYDVNGNGVNDGNDYPASNKFIQCGGPTQAITNANGNYTTYIQPGNYTFSLTSLPPYYTSTPTNQSVAVPNAGDVSAGNDFALQPIPGIQDLSIDYSAFGWWAPGFWFGNTVTVCNQGTEVESGSASLTFDDTHLEYFGSTPTADVVTANQLTWNFTGLTPGQCLYYNVELRNDSTTALGEFLPFSATVLPVVGDTTPANNTFNDSLLVQGSYDPNDKAVSRELITPDEVPAGQWLTYKIRFQNTGTAQAFNVKIRDTLSTMLDYSTFRVLSHSHPMTYTLDTNRQVVFFFNDIMLPDSNANEPESHGFVKYQIKANTNLQLGDEIDNTAYIFFDFNLPIITNTITTRIDYPESIFEAANKAFSLSLFPNPADGFVQYELSLKNAQTITIRLKDLLGREVATYTKLATSGKLDLANLHGLYLIEAEADGNVVVGKVVVR